MISKGPIFMPQTYSPTSTFSVLRECARKFTKITDLKQLWGSNQSKQEIVKLSSASQSSNGPLFITLGSFPLRSFSKFVCCALCTFSLWSPSGVRNPAPKKLDVFLRMLPFSVFPKNMSRNDSQSAQRLTGVLIFNWASNIFRLTEERRIYGKLHIVIHFCKNCSGKVCSQCS